MDIGIFTWLPKYKKSYFPGDLTAGFIVMFMLVPQSMAYALLAGLPAYIGLYACVLPLLIYGLLGSSMSLAVGPVAIISLMIASALGNIASPESTEYIIAASTLAMLCGGILILFGVLRFDYFVNYLSRPVLSGFISAATILISINQLEHLLGLTTPDNLNVFETIMYTFNNFHKINPVTAAIGVFSIGILLLTRKPLEKLLNIIKAPQVIISTLPKAGAIIVVILGILLVYIFELNENYQVDIIGVIPDRLPSMMLPPLDFSLTIELLPAALLISLVGYIEGISVARLLASKHRHKVRPRQELIAIGAANLGAAFSGAFPIAGGIARSSVNSTAGANTPLSSIITAILIAIFILSFAPTLYFLPKAILSSIVILAVISLFDLKPIIQTWNFNKADSISVLLTFIGVLVFGVEVGILVGTLIAIAFYLWRTSHPYIATVGRVHDTEHYKDIHHNKVITYPNLIAIRIDESLYFANCSALEEKTLELVARNQQTNSVLLICSAINFIDTTALATLKNIVIELRESGVELYVCEIKESVMEQLNNTDFFEFIGIDKTFNSTHEAVSILASKHTNVT